MSERKTYLSRAWPEPFDFDLVSSDAKKDVERSLDFATYQRLAVIMDRITQDRFVHVSGRSWKQVSRYLRGDKAPAEVLQAIAAEAEASMDWLTQGILRTAADARYQQDLLEKAASPRVQRMSRPRPEPEWSTLAYALKLIDDRLAELKKFVPVASATGASTGGVADLNQPGMISIPRYDEVRPSAGPGAVAIAEVPTTRVAFERHWLIDIGVQPDAAVILPAQGDSMSPTIPNGAPMLVDTSKTEVRSGYIYVIAVENDLLVKRVKRRLDGLFDLISDNTAYQTETLDASRLTQLRVVGRVYAAVNKF